MKKLWVAAAIALAAVTMTTVPADVYAKRIGGGKSLGMKRQATPPTAPSAAPTASPAAAPAAAGAAAAAKPARSWMGPIAGLAAGLGLAALFSSMGLGGELANFMMIALLVMAAVVAVRFIMRRMNPGAAQQPGLRPAAAGMGGSSLGGASPGATDALTAARNTTTAFQPLNQPAAPLQSGSAYAPAGSQPVASSVPPDFDGPAFERVAKLLFIRLQAANDAGQIDDLRKFTTPELFAELRLDIQERGATTQRTDVVQLDAQLQDVARENHQGSDLWVASVRFHGLIREEQDGAAQAFDEVWHFIRPAASDDAEWHIGGIAQN